MKKILITGSSGYVGKNLISYLRSENNYIIHGLDIDASSRAICDEFFQIDIKNYDELSTISHSYDVIIHLAAKISVNESLQKRIYYYENNCIGTYNILNALSFDQIIFASSGGITGVGCVDSTPYLTSKKVCEDIIIDFCNDIPYDILRFSNIVGSLGSFPQPNDGLFYALTQMKKTGEISIFGTDYSTIDGSAIRDYVHVADICECIRYAIDNPSDAVHNLGNGVGYTVLEIVNAYIENNGLNGVTIHHMPRREGDAEHHIMDDISPLMHSAKYTIPMDLIKTQESNER